MSNRYIVAEGQEFCYPADPISLKIVQDAGGLSKLSPEQRLQVKYKRVKAGEDCSDMSASGLAFHLSVGEVIEVGGPSVVTKPVIVPLPIPVIEGEDNG
jgi:hypothetical protein